MLSKNVLITGDSRGLGKSLSNLYKSNGYTVFGLNRNIVDLRNTNDLKNYCNKLQENRYETVIINAATVGLELDKKYFDIWSSACEEIYLINFLNQARLVETLLPNIEKNLIFISSRIASYNRYQKQLTYEFPFRKLVYASTKISMNHLALYYAMTNPKLRIYSIAPGSLNNQFEGKYTKNKDRISPDCSANLIYNIIKESEEPSGSYLNYDGKKHPL